MRKLYKTLGRLSLLAAGLLTASGAYAAGNGATYNGTVTGEFDNGTKYPYTLNYSVTWNANETLTVDFTCETSIPGFANPYLNINGAEKGGFTDNNGTYTFTTTDTFSEEGVDPKLSIKCAYALGATVVDIAYTVGSTNSTGGGDDSGNTGGGNTGGEQTGEGDGSSYNGTLTGEYLNNPDYQGQTFTVDWTATWNEAGTITFKLNSIDPLALGAVPQLMLDNAHQANFEGNQNDGWTVTTTIKYESGATPNYQLFMAYDNGGNTAMIPFNYTVGSTNSTGGGDDSGNTGGDEGDGGDEGGDTPGDDVTGEPGATYSGKPVEGTIVGGDYEGQKVTVAWTATWNEDETVTFTITVNPSNLTGLVPQLFIDNAHAGNFESANGEWTYTTTQKYEAGDTPTLAFYITVANGATEQIPFDYTVGAEGNDSGSTTPPGTTPDDDNTDSNVGNGATATGSVKGIFENAQLPGDETVMDIDYTLEWTGTWNEDGTVTITLDINPWVVGLVPQLNVNGVYYDDFKMVNDDNTKYTITTTDTYKEGTTPFSLYMPYTGGTETILLDYEVGASGDSTGVQNIGNALRNDGVYYDLSGRPVANPKHGIFIINGKKVVIR